MNLFQNRAGTKRLVDNLLHIGQPGGIGTKCVPASSQDDDWNINERRLLNHGSAKLNAVYVWHLQVSNHKVRGAGRDLVERIFSVRGCVDHEAAVAKLQREYVSDMGLVVHN
jgi:hypothetical protein